MSGDVLTQRRGGATRARYGEGISQIASAPKRPLWAVTIWDKKFNSVAPDKQKKTVKYHYLLASDLKEKIVPGGNVKLLTTSETDWWTTEDKVAGLVSEGEIVSIPWGGNPNVQYFNGRFVTADNRIATSSDKRILDNKFLYYFMLAKKNTIGSFYRGAGLKHPEMAKVLDMEIPLPDIESQRSFAGCMDRLARVVSVRKSQLGSLSQLVKSRFVEMFGDVETNPKGFDYATVKDVCKSFFWIMPQTPEYIEGGDVPYITSKNIKNGKVDFTGCKYISRDDYNELTRNRAIMPGDFLISMIGTLGEVSIVRRQDGEFYGQNIFLLRLKESIDSHYVFSYLTSVDYVKHWWDKCKNASTQSYLKSGHITGLKIPLPPLALQREFAAFVAKVDKLAFAARQRRDAARKLYRAKIQEFFG